jgi:hypothetical protein
MRSIVACLVLLFSIWRVNAQQVQYTDPDKSDVRQTEFEIIGRINSNILIYKSLRDNYAISVYDMDMKEKERVKMTYMPDRVINAEFLAYPDYCYAFYQYQRRNVVYCMGAKIDGNGKIVGKPMTLDTTEISFFASNKIYSIVNSDNKQRIGIFKINSKNDDNFLVTTLLFDRDLHQIEKNYLPIEMPDRHDYLTEFNVDNNGDFVFARAVQGSQNDNIQKLYLLTKKQGSNSVSETELPLKNQFLDDIRIKVDNFNNHYLLTSFYSKTRQGNIEGLYVTVWDKAEAKIQKSLFLTFDENLRNEARGDNAVRTAFNDYFIRNLVVRKDGGFLLTAESFFSTGRGGGFNRYDYLYGSPFLRPMDYYMFSPYGYGYPWYRYNSLGQSTRYNAQNIAIFSFDSTGKVDWSNVINKNQYDDESDAYIGYAMVNTGDKLHILFNQQEKRLQLLSDQTISPSGQIVRNPTLKNLDRGYDFMPRYGKQIGNRQIVFPCMYRNYLCFARLDL